MTGSVIVRETETPTLPLGTELGQDQRESKHRLGRMGIVLGWCVLGTRGMGWHDIGREVQEGLRPKLHSLSYFCFLFPARSDCACHPGV